MGPAIGLVLSQRVRGRSSPSRHVLVCVASDRSADNGQPTDSLSEIVQREGRVEQVATGGGRARPAVGRCHVL